MAGWTVVTREDGLPAEELIRTAIEADGVVPHTVHADRGTSMTSEPVDQVAQPLAGAPAWRRCQVAVPGSSCLSQAYFARILLARLTRGGTPPP